MKKLLMFLMFISSIYAQNIKTSYFIGVNGGDLTISDRDNTESFITGKVGTYFYDTNEFLISNRFYLSSAKVMTDNTSFYINNLNLDWIWNQIPIIKPFIGVSGGYLYYSASTDNYSSGIYGLKTGVLLYLGNYIELEVGGSIDHATQHTNVWRDNLKKIYGGINISF